MLSWILGLGGSTLAIIAAIYFLPILQPVGKWFGENLPKLFDVFKEGLEDIFDKGATILTVGALVLGGVVYGKYEGKQIGKDQLIKELRQDYKFVPRRVGK